MNKLKTLIAVAAVTALMGGCASAPEEKAPAADPNAAQTAAGDAIAAAKASIKEASSLGWVWRDTGKILKQAQEAYDKGDYAKATKLADQARKQGELAVNQYYLEGAKDMARTIEGTSGLSAEQKAKLTGIEQMIQGHNGRGAYDLASALMAEIKASVMSYTVVKGDSLWRISGKDMVYGNPYQWPLIYKQNASQIKDADLIYPDQNFNISRTPGAGDVAAAVQHAKTRGAWSVGAVEASDKAYLAK